MGLSYILKRIGNLSTDFNRRVFLSMILLASGSDFVRGAQPPGKPDSVSGIQTASPQQDKPYSLDELTKLIEKEIRKMDPWVEGYVEQDYTNSEREGFVGLRVDSEQESNYVFYLCEYDCIKYPYPKDKRSQEFSSSSTSHELWHAISDPIEKKGLLHSNEYSGHSIKEIYQYAEKKTLSDDLKKIPLSYKADKEKTIIDSLIKKIRLSELSLNSCIRSKASIDNYILSIGDHSILFNQEIFRSLSRGINQANNELEFLLKRYGKTNQEQKIRDNLSEILQLKNYEERYQKLKEIRTFLENKYSDQKNIIAPIIYLEYTYSDLENRAAVVSRTVKIENLKDEIVYKTDELEKSNSTGRKDLLESQIVEEFRIFDLWESLLQKRLQSITYDTLKYPSIKIGMINQKIEGIEADLKTKLEEFDKAINFLYNPEETMARMINSLYNLYYGPAQLNLFQLNKEDLDFLLTFTYKGKQLFKKGIEKYGVGLEMLSDGFTPEQIKEKLEFAASFEYKGRTYLWPEANFEIKGQIPIWEKEHNE